MLPDILNLSKIDATEIIDFLYDLFYRDFIELDTFLAKTIYIDPRSDKKDDGKELSFWHVTTRDEKEKIWVNRKPVWKIIARYPDFDRAARLEWIKLILTNHDHEIIKMFYHKETNKKRNIRLYLWAYEYDFVVILQKLGRSESFLVTSFYIDNDKKRQDFEQRYDNYNNGDPDLAGCEWF